MTRTCFGDLGSVRNCWGYRLKLVRNEQEKKDTLLKNVRLFSLKELKKATNNFNRNKKLGEGGFASHYKGTLDDDSVVIVKVLSHGKNDATKNQDSDFTSLINIMSKIRHRNVVELIGCCLEGDRGIIVSEFVGNNSLDRLLYSKAERSELSWSMRASICRGIACGLAYLHEGVVPRVVHRDIKPSNIVLDKNFNPKIVDFETAQLFNEDKSHGVSTGYIVGTYGYMAPEYRSTGICSEKVDVYSFGIVLLEVISGRKVHDFLKDAAEISLVKWVWLLRENDEVLEIVDPSLSDFPEDEVKRYIDVALYCVQFPANLRPSMSEALLMLMGGYDFSKKLLRKPELDFSCSNHPEANELNYVSSSPVSLSKQPSLAAGSTTGRYRSRRVTKSMSKTARGFETEIESDLDTHSNASELMEISHDLETELYKSVEPNISAAASVSRPGDKNAVRPKFSSSSSLSASICSPESVSADILAHEAVEAAEQMQMSHDQETQLETSEHSLSEFMLGKSGRKADVRNTSSTEIDSVIQNEAVDRISFQAEASATDEVLSPKVDLKRPICCTLEKIFEAFKDAHRQRICLYGRGGSGKTTVLNNLFHDLASKEVFDQVLFVTVPRFAYQKYMRDEIVRQLSLDVQESCSEDEIFYLIDQALLDRKVLVILDDVWESFNLREVGIPDPGPENNCWLVLATRSLDVCHAMTGRIIEMDVLSDSEAWELFCCQVGDIVDSPHIMPYAQAISKECYGSSVIISAIGSALREESSVEEWTRALRHLQFNDTASRNDQCFFRRHIKYCYDRLKARDIKTCFLYTALFQRDKEFDVSMLVRCFISEGLVGGMTLAAYKKGHYIIRHLTKASLLQADDNGRMVKMHNVVRDSAFEILLSDIEGYRVFARLPESEKDEVRSFQESSWVTNRADKTDTSNISIHKFLTRAGAHLKDFPSVEEWEQATMVFLMDNECSNLPSNPRCSNLVALLLQRNSCLRVIPASFFDSMPTLRVLNLSKTRIRSLPAKVSSLKSLQILLLRDCERLLVLPPSIGSLKFLEVLDLQGTEVTYLPDRVGELANLKHLRVSFYGSMNNGEYKKLPPKLVSDGILSSLSLRELGIFVYPGDRRWVLNASNITKEISSLKLSALDFHFPKVENLENFVDGSQSWKDRQVTAFNFVIGQDFKRIVSLVSNDAELLYNEGQRCLRFVNGENIPDAVKEVLTRATSFYLDHHLSISYLSEFGINCFDGLKICILVDCPKLIAIEDNQEQGREYLPLLEYLSINYLWNLRSIWFGHVATGSLARLRCLSVHACPKLSYVFTCSMLDNLSNLEELVIEDCVSLKYVVIEDEDEDYVKEFRYCDAPSEVVYTRKQDQFLARQFPALCSLKVLKLHYLPEICGIWRSRWPPLEYISFYNCPKLKNLHMKENDDEHIEEIAADKAWWNSLEWDDPVLSTRLNNCVTQIQIDEL